MRVFENFKDTLNVDVDIELKQKGYLLLAYSDNELGLFKRNIEVQNSLDIPSKLVTPQEAKDIVPDLNIDKLVGGAFCPTDGHANPFKVTYGYSKAAVNLGVEINKFTEVKK